MLTKREKMKKMLYKMKEEIFYRQLHALKGENPRMGSREAATVMSAHRLAPANTAAACVQLGTFYDDQEFIMERAYLQDDTTPTGPFDHDIEHVKIRPLFRHRTPKDKSQMESVDDKVKTFEAKHAEREKESLQFREKHQRESVLAKYSTRNKSEAEKARKELPRNAPRIKRRDGRLSLPANLNPKVAITKSVKSLQGNLKGAAAGAGETMSARRKSRRTEEIAKEEAENINTDEKEKNLPVKIANKSDGDTLDQPDTRLKENVQRHQLRNFVRKLVSPYKNDRPKAKQINGLVPGSNLILSDAIRLKVQNKLRRSSRRHALPNGFHETPELLKLRGAPLGHNDFSVLMHTPPERSAAKKAMAQMSPVREKPKERLFPLPKGKASSSSSAAAGDASLPDDVLLKPAQHSGLESIKGTRLRFDSDRDSVGSSRGHRSSRDTSPDVDAAGLRRSRRSLQQSKTLLDKAKKSAYDSDDQSSIIDVVDSDSDFAPDSELSVRLTRSRRSETDTTTTAAHDSKISTRSSGSQDHWSKVHTTTSSS